MSVRHCKSVNCHDDNGNCPNLGGDGFSIQCVGPWVEDKYFFLEQYLNASREVRRKYADQGNAVFIDLFSGPGKSIIRNEKREIESGGMRALHRDEAPFNEYFYIDILEDNTKTLKQRIGNRNDCQVLLGDSNKLVDELIKQLTASRYKKKDGTVYRYHFAYVDPFAPRALKFETLAKLASLEKMDMLIHFPIGAIKRNLEKWGKGDGTILDNFLGTPVWRDKIKKHMGKETLKILLDIFTEQLKSIGYPEDGLKKASSDADSYSGMPAVSVKNTKGVNLYVLILASKHPLGSKIWESIIKKLPGGQKEFNY